MQPKDTERATEKSSSAQRANSCDKTQSESEGDWSDSEVGGTHPDC